MSRHRKGFTLIEFMLYIFITAILFTFVTDLVLQLLQGKSKLEALTDVGQNSRDAMERMQLAIRNASDVTIPLQGTTSSRIVLQMPTASTNPTIFQINNGILQMQEGTNATTSITANEVAVRSLLVTNLAAIGAPDILRLEMAVSSSNPNTDPDYSFGQPIYGSAAIRKR